MLAAIPYFTIPLMEFWDGRIVVDAWAISVCLAFVVGMEVARARGLRLGLDVRDIVDASVVIVGTGFLFGHMVHVLAYNPHQLEEQGVMALLRVWAGFSSTGGFIGAVLGGFVFFTKIRKVPFWVHADTIMFGLPFGWIFGRLGCFLAHDHVGARSGFALAVDFPAHFWGGLGGPRHDLGLYEALWVMVIAGIFFAFRKRQVQHGFFIALWCFLYAPARFAFEYLRNTDLPGADVRWLGLTPAQYWNLAIFLVGFALVRRLRRGADQEG